MAMVTNAVRFCMKVSLWLVGISAQHSGWLFGHFAMESEGECLDGMAPASDSRKPGPSELRIGSMLSADGPGLQSLHAGIQRETRRTGALRNHDGRAARTARGHHGHDYRCDGAGGAARGVLPEPALAGQAGHGHSDGDEEFDGRERVDSERDGETEADRLMGVGCGV